MAKTDTSTLVRASAIDLLDELKDKTYTAFFENATKDSSYSVAGAALTALADIDAAKATALLPELKKDARGSLASSIEEVEITTKTDADFNEMLNRFTSASAAKKLDEVFNFISYLNNVTDVIKFKRGVDTVVSYRGSAVAYGQDVSDAIDNALSELKAKKTETKKATKGSAKDIKEEIAYLDEKMK
jgi:aminopeptidase N